MIWKFSNLLQISQNLTKFKIHGDSGVNVILSLSGFPSVVIQERSKELVLAQTFILYQEVNDCRYQRVSNPDDGSPRKQETLAM